MSSRPIRKLSRSRPIRLIDVSWRRVAAGNETWASTCRLESIGERGKPLGFERYGGNIGATLLSNRYHNLYRKQKRTYRLLP